MLFLSLPRRSLHSRPAPVGLSSPYAAPTLILHRYSSLLVRSGTNNAETKAIFLVVSGVVAVTVVHLALVVVVVVIAATTVIAGVAVVRVKIPTPLPDVATHIVESVTICFFLCNRMRSIPTVIIIPAYFIKIIAS